MGEKFAANLVTGTGSITVPITTSPGRSGFSPQLALSYDSASGNGPFGIGWSLALPVITRKTDKGLPRYQDAADSDVFIFSGAEDLVPEFKKNTITGQWVKDSQDNFVRNELQNGVYLVRCYRPRIEGLFARIERWTHQDNPKDVFWRSISKDNVIAFYGKTNESRIANPSDESKIFSWLICESYDDKGNAIRYDYKAENAVPVDCSAANERNRSRLGQRYLKRIKYGNKTPRQPNEDLAQRTDWLFEVVFDYGEHDKENPLPNNSGKWLCRHDPFSSYRAGFEVRTYRLCQRVLMFHHFPLEDVGSDCLVRSTDFVYRESRGNPDDRKKGNPLASFIASVTQSGYKRKAGGGYLKRSLPPLEFEYSEAKIRDSIREVDADSLENLPIGLDGTGYQWLDLDGEGVSGILTEQADAWFYKRNLSPISVTEENGVTRSVASFAPMERVAEKPAFAATGSGGWQFQDLAGDGKLNLARFEGPVAGFFERNDEDKWDNFVPFRALPNVNWRDPNLRFVDLTGDGLADVLITEDQAFTSYLSRGEIGFAPSERTVQALDEERGPRLVFADGEQSIYLADLSGDGLTDLVRIRNGEVCYWPNLGYGRFGAKVAMDNAPWFDAPDQFSQRRIRLADVDGSGVTDILYLGRDRITVYFNQSGNGWSAGQTIGQVPRVDNLSAVQVVDLFGNGTACLVWSSPLPGDARCPMRYIDLMGGQKPHLLVKTVNNLGAESRVEYAASTKFYLQDKAAGNPWITKLPFPVHVVEKVTVADKWRQTQFATTYSYHHGYFDGIEREFRGFGRVEQVDVEDYGRFAEGNIDSPYITQDRTLYQPPVKTITWYHTGAALDRQRILTQFRTEYFPNSLAALPSAVAIDSIFKEKPLPEPDLESEDLSADEWREALRACKGMTLRQEVYELDVDELERSGGQVPVRLFSAATHNCNIRRLQPKGDNEHAVFLVTESEALSYHYELDLHPAPPATTLAPDPRIAHTLNLSFDEFGNVRQSIAVGYPRVRAHQDATLNGEQIGLVREVQRERHLAYSETQYTEDAIGPDDPLDPAPAEHYRLRVPCEVQTYELTGFTPAQGIYFDVSELRGYRLSDTLPDQGLKPVVPKKYHEVPQNTLATMRLVEQARTLFFKDDLSGSLDLGKLGKLGLTYEQYKLALTEALLDAVFTGGQLAQSVPAGGSVRDALNDWKVSGYLSGAAATDKFGPAASGQYWMRSGVAGFAPDAAQHFYLPEKYTDPFDNPTTLEYDNKYDLFIQSSTDALGNTTRMTRFDYRVLAPAELEDVNANRTEAYFDVLGRVIAVALKGKGNDADSMIGYDDELANPELAQVLSHFDGPSLPADDVRDLFSPILGNATTRFLYHFGEKIESGRTVWGDRPAGACAIVRERHVASLTPGDPPSPLQIAFECSDGMGAVLMKRSQAEPEQAGGPLRWIVSGKTVLNNKGKPVKQYEPYFSVRASCCAEGDVHEEVGVTPLMYYDAAGRLVRTEMPDGTLSRVEFSPWHVRTFDANDTVLESRWYQDRGAPALTDPEPSDPEQRAAWLAVRHAGTPALTILDSLGREVIGIAHNKYTDSAGALRDEKYLTFTKLDAEGKPLWIRDARGNLVMQYLWPAKPDRDDPRVARDFSPTGNPNNDVGLRTPCYDIAGNLLFQHSMDAGNRWMISDAAGKPMFSWDRNERQTGTVLTPEDRLYFTKYDRVHRPAERWLRTGGGTPKMIERVEYRDTRNAGGTANAQLAADQAANLIGRLVRHYDPSGLTETVRHDFKGNVLEVERRLNNQPTESLIDWQGNPLAKLEAETFRLLTEYDALNRITLRYNWHRHPAAVAAYRPKYNPRGVLESEKLRMRASRTAAGLVGGVNAAQPDEIREIRYNAKGQKTFLQLGNGTLTQHDYDPATFRLQQIRTTRPGDAANFPGRRALLADAQIVQQLLYTYDPAGNVTEIADEAYEPVFFQNQQVEPRSRYEYDALYRLTIARGREDGALAGAPRRLESAPRSRTFTGNETQPGALRNYTQTYRYDAVGNVERMHHEAGTGTWTRSFRCADESNRLLATWDANDGWPAVDPTIVTPYDFDTHGNMLNLARSDPRFNLRWDHRDMIASIDLGGGGQAYYQYDAGKQRTRKRIVNQNGLGGYWERIYLGGYELYRRYNGSGTTVVEEIESHHLCEGEQRVLLVDDVIASSDAAHPRPDGLSVKGQTLFRYQYGNHLGSACLELDHEAEIISYQEYHPYGTSAYRAMKSGIEAPPNRYRYTGMERDDESGLNCHRKRSYLALLGRWTSSDPAGIVDGANTYVFAGANPVRYVDNEGEAKTEAKTLPPIEPMREGMLIGDYPGLSSRWRAATNAVLERMYEKGSYESNLKAFQDDLMSLPKGSNRQKGTAIFKARKTFDKVQGAFAKLVSLPEGTQVHHALTGGGVAEDPLGALDASHLEIARGQAAVPGTTHNRAHLAKELEAEGVKNPGLEATKSMEKAKGLPKPQPAEPAPVEPVAPAAEPVVEAAPPSPTSAGGLPKGGWAVAGRVANSVGMLAGGGLSVAAAVDAAEQKDTVGTVVHATLASAQLTGGTLYVSGWAAGSAEAMAAGSAIAAPAGAASLAFGSIMLAVDEGQRASRGEKTGALEAAEFYADLVNEGEKEGGVTGVLKQVGGWTGGFFATLIAVGQGYGVH